jgi:hypothetical protein
MEGDSAAESAVADGNALDVNQHAAQCSETASSGAPSGSVPLITLGHRRSMQTSSDIAVGINDSTNGPPDVMDSRSRQGSAMAMAPNAIEGDVANGPVEGQESLLWYDQLFASSFNAIENPFLVAAEFDTSIDTTWSHLR